MNRPPAIVDTTVVVAGLLTRNPDSPTAHILDGMTRGNLHFLLTVPLVAEYRAVLLRPKIAEVHGLDTDEVDQLLEEIVLNAGIREATERAPDAPDPGDQHLWDLPDAEPTALLVTGDRALLENPPPGRSVVSPRDYLALASTG
jgi:predicted nucleic acid-binding protein